MYLPVLKPSFWIYIYFFFTDGERYFSIFISHLYILNSMNSQKKNKDMGEDMCACACVIDMLVSMCWCQRRYQVSCSITVCFVPLVNRFITEPGVVLVASKPHWSFSLYLYIDLGYRCVWPFPVFGICSVVLNIQLNAYPLNHHLSLPLAPFHRHVPYCKVWDQCSWNCFQ